MKALETITMSGDFTRPIKVMYLIDTHIIPPESISKGGAETQLYQLILSLNAEHFRSVVVQLSPQDSLPIRCGRMGNTEIFHLPTIRIHSLNGLQQLRRLYSIAKNKDVDIIHTYFEKSEVMGWITCQLAGIPIWVTSRRDLGFKRKEIYNKIFRLTRKNCKKCVSNCLAVKNRALQEEGLSEEKMEVIYNGLDFSLFQNLQRNGILRKELGISNGIPMVGMVANFNFEIKGHRYFLEGARNILEKFPDVLFLLIGDGPLRKKYEEMANEFGIRKKVRFLGKRNDAPSIISNLDISVLSSTSEGLSNVILESMAAGIPVVATNVGGSKEMVEDGITGYLVPPTDSEAIADAIITLIVNPDKAISMGVNGKRVVQEKFTIEAMVKRYESLYQGLVKNLNNKEIEVARFRIP